MENKLSLGLNTPFSLDLDLFEDWIDDLITNNILDVRIVLASYNIAANVAIAKQQTIIANNKGARTIFGVAGTALTALTWGDFHDAVLDAASWAQANNVYEFQIGNEEEYKVDGTTLTVAQLILNLKALATEVKAIYTRGKISYACAINFYKDWITAGKGDLDFFCANVYRGGTGDFSVQWKNQISNLKAAFGVDGFYITEFNVSYTSLDAWDTDENTQTSGITEMIKYIQNSEIKRAYFYSYLSDLYGARKDDGTYRKLWDVLKITNDWRRRKTASKSGLGGLSHG